MAANTDKGAASVKGNGSQTRKTAKKVAKTKTGWFKEVHFSGEHQFKIVNVGRLCYYI